MRLLVDAGSVDGGDGVGRVTFELGSRLVARGWRLRVLTGVEGDLADRWRDIGVPVDVVGAATLDRRRLAATAVRVARWVAAGWRFGPDVVWATDVHRALGPALLARVTGVPVVVHLHHPVPDRLHAQARLLLASAAGIVASSAHTARAWRPLGADPGRTTVVHGGVALPTTQAPGPGAPGLMPGFSGGEEGGEAVLVGLVGRMVAEKGVDVAIAAVERLAGARLLVAGREDTAEAEVVAKVRASAVAEWVGYLADPTELYRVVDVVVVPSRYAEPMGRVALEALAAGTPVVASAVGGLPELLEGCPAARLVPPGEAAALATAVGELAALRRCDPGLAAAARAHVADHFDVDHAADRFADALEAVQVRRSPAPVGDAHRHRVRWGQRGRQRGVSP